MESVLCQGSGQLLWARARYVEYLRSDCVSKKGRCQHEDQGVAVAVGLGLLAVYSFSASWQIVV